MTDVDSFPPAGAPLIRLRGVGVWYRLRHRPAAKSMIKRLLRQGEQQKLDTQFWALRELDLEFLEGQVVGIVGHNGAGKSTLCQVLTRILVPDEGTAEIHGTVTPLLTLGAGFTPELSGVDNIFVYGAYLGIPRSVVQEKAAEIFEFSGLGRFLDQPVYTYSSGMRARLGFSIASALRPEILILDEILGVGDREFQEKSRRRILEMMAESKLILVVSHSTEKLRDMCTHALWLERGRVKQFGEAGAILDAYDEAMTARSGLDADADATKTAAGPRPQSH